MKSKHIAADTEAQVHVIILDTGEEAFAALTRFANESGFPQPPSPQSAPSSGPP